MVSEGGIFIVQQGIFSDLKKCETRWSQLHRDLQKVLKGLSLATPLFFFPHPSFTTHRPWFPTSALITKTLSNLSANASVSISTTPSTPSTSSLHYLQPIRLTHKTHARTHVIIDLATYALGSSIVDVTNEFFAPARSMLSPNPPISLPDKFVGMYRWWWTIRKKRSW